MPHKKTAAAGTESGRWARVAFINGGLAATAGFERAANPHPPGSASARSWLAGWRTGEEAPPASPGPAPLVPTDEGPIDMTMTDKLPTMSDGDLGTLLSNAERLAQAGTPKQRQAAAAMLPSLQAEAGRRQEQRPPKRPPARARKAAPAETV